jgi:hypothetical protein
LMSKTAGRSSITNSPFCGLLVCACAADAAQLRTMSAARQVPLIVILILSGSPSELLTQGGLGPTRKICSFDVLTNPQ